MVTDKLSEVLNAFASLAQSDVLVGVPDSAPERKDGPLSNAQIGYILETGSPANNLPARPHLIPGVASIQDAAATRLGLAASAAIDGDTAAAERHMSSAGMLGQNAVRRRITTGPFAPLAESTLAARRRRGRTGTKPLLDTGQYRNSITYVVRRK